MATHKLLQEIQERNQLVAKTFLLNGKDWKEIKVGGEWKKWNGEKTTWKNFVLQHGDSVWTVDRAIDCYKFFCEEWGMTIEEVYGEEGISSKNLIAILGARMSKKETEELLGVARITPAATKDRIRDLRGEPPEECLHEKKETRCASCHRKVEGLENEYRRHESGAISEATR